MTLSVSLIVKNESKYIAGCLKSVINAADEIIIVDTGCTDDTIPKIKLYDNPKIKFYEFPWCDDFSAARNYAIEQCTGDWGMWIDADERLCDIGTNGDDGAGIRTYLERLEPSFAGAKIRMYGHQHIPGGRGHNLGENDNCNWYTKFFRIDPWIRFNGRVHEELYTAIVVHNGLGVKAIPEDIASMAHLGYDASDEQILAKLDRNHALLERDLIDKPGDAWIWYHFGQEYAVRGDRKKQVECFGKALAIGTLPQDTVGYINGLLKNYKGKYAE